MWSPPLADATPPDDYQRLEAERLNGGPASAERKRAAKYPANGGANGNDRSGWAEKRGCNNGVSISWLPPQTSTSFKWHTEQPMRRALHRAVEEIELQLSWQPPRAWTLIWSAAPPLHGRTRPRANLDPILTPPLTPPAPTRPPAARPPAGKSTRRSVAAPPPSATRTAAAPSSSCRSACRR